MQSAAERTIGPALGVGTTGTVAVPLTGSRSPVSPLAASLEVAGCAVQTVWLLLRHRIRQPTARRGRTISFADGTSATVYRETVVDRGPTRDPAFLAVSFQLRVVRRDWAHALFRTESLLNTVLFAGFPGLVSKLWLRHDQTGVYRGLYEWDDPNLALRYVHALWWVLALVSRPGSIHYAVLPGLGRDQVLSDPRLVSGQLDAECAWWLPLATALDGRAP